MAIENRTNPHTEAIHTSCHAAETNTKRHNETGMHTHVHEDGSVHTHSHGHDHEHPNAKAVSNRLARAIGHLEKVKHMVDEGEDCSQVLIQLAAVRSAINNAGKVLLMDHIDHCIVEAVAEGNHEMIEELNEAIKKFVK